MRGERDIKLIFGYARQSLARSADAGDSVSVADQFRLIEEHAARIGATVGARFSDVDISGARESRDGLDRLLAAVREVKPDAVLIRDVSRLARDTRLFLTLVDGLNAQGVRLLSATENLEDRTLSTIISAIAERERLNLAGRVAGGVREHARRGKTHGRPAYGYRRIDGVLSIQEDEAAVVRTIFAAFAAGEPVAAIRDRLNQTGPPPPEAAAWKRDTIEKLLKRRVYRGDVVIAARRDISGRLWPEVVTESAHPAIIERSVWEAAQARFRTTRPALRGELVSPFSGLLACAGCGQPLYALISRRTNRPTDLRVARCATHANRRRNGEAWLPACPVPVASRSLAPVEDAAAAAVRVAVRAIGTEAEVIALAATMASAQTTDAADLARARLAEIERRRARLLEAYESGALELATWQTRERALTADLERQQAILAAEPAPPDIDHLLAVRRTLAAMPEERLDFRVVLTGLSAHVAVNLETLVARVIVGPEFAPLFPAAVTKTP